MSHHNRSIQRAEDCGSKPRFPLSHIAPQILLSVALLFGLSASSAKASTYYVSPDGNNTDGLTYQTAFNELDQIKWNSLNSAGGIHLVIDGGVNGLVYFTPLTVPAGAYANSISTSSDAGHSGVVYIDGENSTSTSGINIIGGVGSLRGLLGVNNMTVQNWTGSGIRISGSALEVQRVIVESNAVGLEVVSPSGSCNSVSFSIFHDNTNNIVNNRILNNLTTCWIYQDYDISPRACTGLSTSQGSINASDCVFGPGLVYGVKGRQFALLNLTNCLLLNASGSNVLLSGSYPTLNMTNCTSFMTKLNSTGGVHSCINSIGALTGPPPFLYISKSIFEGGAVRSPVGEIAASNDTEYAVTGNTTVLASTQSNPEFISNVAAYPDNVSFSALTQSNFALQKGSPATGEGSSLTSVSALLNQF